MNWYLEVLKKYAVFDGRARRSEYWQFTLVNIGVILVLSVLDAMISKVTGIQIGILGAVYGLGVLLPAIGVSIRRLHDTNRSGWWLLLAFVPLVGLVLLMFMVQDSEPAPNLYGQNPKMAIA
jgi:uncharacterized membrane protein YhaH (DUF805 family)